MTCTSSPSTAATRGRSSTGCRRRTPGADVTPDGSTLALLTYTRIILYAAESEGKLIDLAELRRIELDTNRTRQAESITWDGRALIFGNEQRTLFRIPDPLAEGVDRYPPAR